MVTLAACQVDNYVFIIFKFNFVDYKMVNLLFGDNQFFGVNHMSEEKARSQALKFQEIDSVMSVLDAAYDEGIKTFMCTTHDRVAQICDIVRSNSDRYTGYEFYPCMPYAHKYANAVTEYGMLGALRRFIPTDGLIDTIRRGAAAVARKDIENATTLLIDAEMKMFADLATPVIFLQNVVVDFLMGLGFKDAFRIFSNHVRDRYKAEPGFITMNMPALLDVLDEVKVENPVVCANINKIGFRMCGGFDAYEKSLKERQFQAIAMSVFASGAISADDAIEWICKQPNIRGIVFGASSHANIRRTRELVERYSGRATTLKNA